MSFLRKLLFPFALIYWLITALRNYFYNNGIFKSYSFPVPVIAIGNLSTGGTGKTPQTEYLIRLLSAHYRVATLSRGYKRKSKGFVLGNANSTSDTLGDEPYQFFSKFKNITIAVDANRKNGIEQLLTLNPSPQIILLDDAYQHRRVKAGSYILLTAYTDIYANDYMLPAGNLRESRSGAKRASIIIVTKCPPQLSEKEQQQIILKLKPQPVQKVYFTCIDYDAKVYSNGAELEVDVVRAEEKVLVAGIAKPKPFFEYLQGPNDTVKTYPDHHDFTENEIKELQALAQQKIIITTEKDYMRLNGKLPAGRLFYLAIASRFLAGSTDFDNTILEYIQKDN